MTNELAAAAEAGLNSLVLDEGGVNEKPLSDNAFDAPKTEEAKPEPKAPSNREALEKALGEVEAKDKTEAEAKAEEPAKDKADEKPVKGRSDDGKFAKADEAKADEAAEKPKTERDGSEAGRQSEGRDTPHREPPARFTPEAREKWISAPREVRSEVYRVVQEYERELGEHKAFRDDLKEYEDLAKQHNVTIKDTMARYVNADRILNQNFGSGVANLAQMYGHSPVQAIAAIIQAHGITPQQYAEQVLKNPAQHVAPMQRQQAPQTQQQAPEIQNIKSEIESLRNELASERAQAQLTPVIQKFADEHPDFHALEDAIARILQDGVIDRIYGPGLSPDQKLAEAYRIAGGKPTSHAEPQADDVNSEAENVPSPIAGTKSVKGAPTGGKDPSVKRFKNNRDAAAAALAEIGIA